ncbi:uncharacterized protein LOC119584771 [Penaeus monodon]|uniref:uncharacterized protein LOC119584771 n=1 Tax=Penaeus monodon TaxID=6687 RepID=UPI0018A72A4B|nr:uncharacterized protein LOC119584771 [Penaeus monodon]
MIQECYKDVTARDRSTVGMTEHFEVKVGLHQGPALSSLLFNTVFDVITENVREETPWCVLQAVDIVLVAESRRVLKRKLEEWRFVLESRGKRISRSKTEYFTTDVDGDQLATIKRVPIRLKGKVHKAVVRPALTYGLETVPLEKLEEKKGTVEVLEISKKIQEAKLGWFSHLRRRAGEDHVGREVMETEVQGNRRRGTARTR